MARQNDVRLYGCVTETPIIVRKSDSSISRACFHLSVIRSSRYNGEGVRGEDRIMYDHPFILSTDPDMMTQISHLKQYDIVEIKGTFVTKKIKKVVQCKACGHTNKIDGNICFVHPMFLAKRNSSKTQFTKDQAIQEVLANREISNGIIMLGNLCQDVTYFHEGNVQTSTYQVATDRKYFIGSDDPMVRTDYPLVRSYGKMAKKDKMCIHTGSLILIDGYLHTRQFPRKIVCEACNKEREWTDSTTEVIPFINEYLRDYIDPEEAVRLQEEKKIEDGKEALKKAGLE